MLFVICLKPLLLNVLLCLAVRRAAKADQGAYIRLELWSDHRYLPFQLFKSLMPTMSVLCLLRLHYAYITATGPALCLLCLICLYYVYYFPTILTLRVCDACYVCTISTMFILCPQFVYLAYYCMRYFYYKRISVLYLH